MPTSQNAVTFKRKLDSYQFKRLLYKLSTAPLPEPKPINFAEPKRPTYLRYIEYM